MGWVEQVLQTCGRRSQLPLALAAEATDLSSASEAKARLLKIGNAGLKRPAAPGYPMLVRNG